MRYPRVADRPRGGTRGRTGQEQLPDLRTGRTMTYTRGGPRAPGAGTGDRLAPPVRLQVVWSPPRPVVGRDPWSCADEATRPRAGRPFRRLRPPRPLCLGARRSV